MERGGAPERLRFSLFEDQVPHGISTRGGGVSVGAYGSLNLGSHVGDVSEAVRENRRRFLESVGLSSQETVVLSQVHSNRIVLVGGTDRGRGMLAAAPPALEADALLTQAPGLGLLVIAADCVLLLLWDPIRRAVGAVHAGWRGAVARIAPLAVQQMGRAFGTVPQDVRVGIGPAIGSCCYEVDDVVLGPVRSKFPQWSQHVLRPGRPGHGYLDLQELNRLQLVDAGVAEDHIQVLRLCTSCRGDLFFSERAQGYPCGRFGAVIALPKL